MTPRHSNQQGFYDFLDDVYSGTAVGLGHSAWYATNLLGKGWRFLTGNNKENNLNTDHSTRPNSLKVVGVGYGRTGTYSLALALDALGFPTLHTQHLYENHDIFNNLVKDIFHNSIIQNEIIMGSPNYDLLLDSGFTATMDLPFALYYSQIHELYPDCKFILTVRENSEVWFKSWNVMTSSITRPAMYTSWLVTHVKKLEWYMRYAFVSFLMRTVYEKALQFSSNEMWIFLHMSLLTSKKMALLCSEPRYNLPYPPFPPPTPK